MDDDLSALAHQQELEAREHELVAAMERHAADFREWLEMQRKHDEQL